MGPPFCALTAVMRINDLRASYPKSFRMNTTEGALRGSPPRCVCHRWRCVPFLWVGATAAGYAFDLLRGPGAFSVIVGGAVSAAGAPTAFSNTADVLVLR
jgi:hypothetical protein